MSHYEQRLEHDLLAIRARVADVGRQVQQAVKDAVRAVLTLDHDLAYRIVLGDMPVNREIRDIDRVCHGFVARHLPSAGHLRFVSSVLRLNVALERIGDYAVAIAREAVQLSTAPPDTVRRDIELLDDQNRAVLKQAMQAFNEANAELARGTAGLTGQLAGTFDRVFADLLRAGEKGKRPIRDLFALLVIFNRLGRVGDQAKNICEETLFTVSGETKQPKVYRILFVDARNDRLSQLAEAYARKAFPEAGRYASAGWDPADALADPLPQFADRIGYDMTGSAPKPLETSPEQLARYHVIVDLDGALRSRLTEVPFHTVLLAWKIDEPAGGTGEERLESLNQQLAVEIGSLVETLRGGEAA